jgi:NRAMP (natural resistance-associated macrophage protein)-like metal ion transporter
MESLDKNPLDKDPLDKNPLDKNPLDTADIDPGALEPEALDPGALDPGALDPEALDPGALDPEALDPGALDPGALDPGALDPEALDPRTLDRSSMDQEQQTAPTRRTLFGPGLFVTAAFIGPGTVLAASTAGANFGYALLWAVVFSALATMVLQEMAARLGIVTGAGLAEAIRASVSFRSGRWALLGLVLIGIFVGNAAYQTGNMLGAATGLDILAELAGVGQAVAPEIRSGGLVSGVAMIALGLIWIGSLDLLRITLTGLVALMGCLFIAAAVLCQPDWLGIAKGLFPGRGDATNSATTWTILGLIGTTVVPYNLFLHASSAAARWPKSEFHSRSRNAAAAIRHSFWDTLIAVTLGGVITACLVITAAVAFAGDATFANIRQIGDQLKPALGAWSSVVFAIGIFSAGLTSSLTAPVAAAYAAAGCFGWPAKLNDLRLKLIATVVVVAGLVFGLLFGSSPKAAILTAQVANALLLPIIAGFLIVLVNRKSLMRGHHNSLLANGLAGTVWIVIAMLAVRQLIAFGTSLSSWWT